MAKKKTRSDVQSLAREALAWLERKMVGPPAYDLPPIYLLELGRRMNDLWDAYFEDQNPKSRDDRRALDTLVEALGWNATESRQLLMFAAERIQQDRTVLIEVARDSRRLATIRSALSNLADGAGNGKKNGLSLAPQQLQEGQRAATSKRTGGRPTRDKPTVSDRMEVEALKNHDARGYSAGQWALRLSCAKSSVCNAKFWKALQIVKAGAKADKLEADINARGGRQNRRRKKPNEND